MKNNCRPPSGFVRVATGANDYGWPFRIIQQQEEEEEEEEEEDVLRR